MLSRTANNIYWMARSLERAENMTRLLDVSHNMALMPNSRGGQQELLAPLSITGRRDQFHARHDKVSTEALLEFFLFDESNDGSIFSCIQLARANAHSVRDRLSAEAWESINTTWLELRHRRHRSINHEGVKGLFDWIKQRSHEFRGAAYGTMLHNDAFLFMRLGTFIERADNTARILNAKLEVMAGERDSNQAIDFYQWNALLQSLGAYEAYHYSYTGGLSARNVTELLILSAQLPRSLRYCVGAIMEQLSSIEGSQGLAAKRLCSELHARLQYGEVDYILEFGLHDYLNDLLRRINTIGDEIHRSYWEGA
ncbi:alpha-E domain-containing protein [Microbulbifer bruguierae]|uniref:Alpha-E domain-containing protein n=1 Tax=Microbulbifer bruguierae TaxID=3029061 RepID=A0ABY8NEC2_9GAMM|nr:alpha-E domain-containing protein [Microbulbifer bruguierae]WGL16790.1 alpha-E domain-containing protein [Microbulbifer bruguierae]